MYNFASGPHGDALLRIGENLADHRLVEPPPPILGARVRRQNEVQGRDSLVIHRGDCIASMEDPIIDRSPTAQNPVRGMAPPAASAIDRAEQDEDDADDPRHRHPVRERKIFRAARPAKISGWSASRKPDNAANICQIA